MENFHKLTRLEFPNTPGGYLGTFIPVGNDCYVYPEYTRLPKHEFTFLVYRFDPATGSMVLSPQHPLHGLKSPFEDSLYPMPPYLFNVQHIQEASPTDLVRQIKEWLSRIGVQRDGTPRTNITVSDLATGERLRQLNGVHSAYSKLSPDGRFTVGTDGTTIHLYDVPHHLWTKSLSWLQWLGWGLVFLWPLRYLRDPPRKQMPYPSPQSSG